MFAIEKMADPHCLMGIAIAGGGEKRIVYAPRRPCKEVPVVLAGLDRAFDTMKNAGMNTFNLTLNLRINSLPATGYSQIFAGPYLHVLSEDGFLYINYYPLGYLWSDTPWQAGADLTIPAETGNLSLEIIRIGMAVSMKVNGDAVYCTQSQSSHASHWSNEINPTKISMDGFVDLVKLQQGEDVRFLYEPQINSSDAPVYDGLPSDPATPMWLAPLRPNQARNFATNPATWPQAAANLAANGAGDFTLELDFACLQQNEDGKAIFRAVDGSTFKIILAMYYNANIGKYYLNVTFFDTAGTRFAQDLILAPELKKTYRFKAVYASSTLTIYFDGVLKKSGAVQLDFAGTPTVATNAACNLSKFALTTGTTVWQAAHADLWETNHPWPSVPSGTGSWPEQTRLLTLNNVNPANGVFEAADVSKAWSVKTALDFRGYYGELSCVCKVQIPHPLSDGQYRYYSMIEQGFATSSSIVMRFNAIKTPGGLLLVDVQLNFAGNVFRVTTPTSKPFEPGWRVLAFTYDPVERNLTIYVDGIAFNKYKSPTPEPLFHDPAYQSVSIGEAGITHKIEYAMVFDRVLTPEQIAIFTPTDNPVKYWVVPCSAGRVNIETVGFENLEWTLPDGSKSTATTLNLDVTAGLLVCRYTGLTAASELKINNSMALRSSQMKAADLPRVTNALQLALLPGLTGAAADLPRVTGSLYLSIMSGLTGAVADLPRVANYCFLNTIPGLTGTTADLPRVTSILQLFILDGLTGTTADLPRVTSTLSLQALPQLTGSVADLPRVTYYLHLFNLPGLTGSTDYLPVNTGERVVQLVQNITGALSVASTNNPVGYYNNASVTPAEYDQTIQNIVDAGCLNGTLEISNTRTSASDANLQTLKNRGWTITEL